MAALAAPRATLSTMAVTAVGVRVVAHSLPLFVVPVTLPSVVTLPVRFRAASMLSAAFRAFAVMTPVGATSFGMTGRSATEIGSRAVARFGWRRDAIGVRGIFGAVLSGRVAPCGGSCVGAVRHD